MSVALNEIRNRNNNRRKLNTSYKEKSEQYVAHYDDAELKKKNTALSEIKSNIAFANAGVEREIDFLDKGCMALAETVLSLQGTTRPEPGSEQVKVTEYLKALDKVVDDHLAVLYSKLPADRKPFGSQELPDGNSQKTVDGAIVEAHAEKKDKTKAKGRGRRNKKDKDDGSEAEAASECVTKPLTEENEKTLTDAPGDEGNASEEDVFEEATPSEVSDKKSSKPTLEDQVAAEEERYEEELTQEEAPESSSESEDTEAENIEPRDSEEDSSEEPTLKLVPRSKNAKRGKLAVRK